MGMKESENITRMKRELAAGFSMVDLRSISFDLGLKVERDQEKITIQLSQPTYIDKIFHKFHLNQVNLANTPIKELAALLPCTKGQASNAEIEKY